MEVLKKHPSCVVLGGGGNSQDLSLRCKRLWLFSGCHWQHASSVLLGVQEQSLRLLEETGQPDMGHDKEILTLIDKDSGLHILHWFRSILGEEYALSTIVFAILVSGHSQVVEGRMSRLMTWSSYCIVSQLGQKHFSKVFPSAALKIWSLTAVSYTYVLWPF